jgi:hypothetical protein
MEFMTPFTYGQDTLSCDRTNISICASCGLLRACIRIFCDCPFFTLNEISALPIFVLFILRQLAERLLQLKEPEASKRGGCPIKPAHLCCYYNLAWVSHSTNALSQVGIVQRIEAPVPLLARATSRPRRYYLRGFHWRFDFTAPSGSIIRPDKCL